MRKKHDECLRSVLICKSIHFNFCISLCIKRKHEWLHPQKPHSSNTGTIMTKRQHVFYCSFYVFFPFFTSFYFLCSVFFIFCVLFFLTYIIVCFVFLCSFTENYHQVWTQMQLTNTKSCTKWFGITASTVKTSDVPSANSSVSERKKTFSSISLIPNIRLQTECKVYTCYGFHKKVLLEKKLSLVLT